MARHKKKKDNLSIISLLFAIVVVFAYYYYQDIKSPEVEKLNSIKNIQPAINNVSTDLNIYFFDVGQADSILITNNNHNMLIDAGNNEDGKHIVDYIQNELKINNLDYIVGTHPHEDHIGGLDDVINNLNIENVMLPDVITTTRTFEDVIASIENKNLSVTIPTIGEVFYLGEAKIEVIYTGSDESDLNNCSIVLKMTFGETTYLFTGDASDKVESTILDKDIDIDVLKVGHHGAKTASTAKFIAKTTPEYAIISVAANNSYGHPSKETIQRLNKYTDKIYLTSELGTIKLISNGKNITITNFKTNIDG